MIFRTSIPSFVPALVAVFVVAALPAPVAGQASSALSEQIDAVFQEWDRPDAPAAAVAVTRDGLLLHSRGFGSASLEYEVPAGADTPFHVASVSKQFATFAVALLARDGLLDWDDDVRTHLPDLPDLGHTITLRHLANHTSGVRDQWELLAMAGWRLDDVITRDQILAMMARQRELNFRPGSAYLYSNMGYSLLAEVVEAVSGEDFGAFLEARVFEPLGMHHTHVHDNHTRVVPGRAYSYRPTSDGWQHAVLSYANRGATSLFTTAEDLARWIAEMESPTVGDEALWREMRARGVLNSGDTISYGLGVMNGSYRGLRTVGHGGADAGFRADLLHFPDQRVGVVVLGASASFSASGKAREVADIVLADELGPVPERGGGGGGGGGGQVEIPPAADPMEAYAGLYWSPELETFYRMEVDEGGEGLVALHQRHPSTDVVPMGEDRFMGSAWFLRQVEFTRTGSGEIDGFVVSGSRVRDLRFHRVEEGALPGG